MVGRGSGLRGLRERAVNRVRAAGKPSRSTRWPHRTWRSFCSGGCRINYTIRGYRTHSHSHGHTHMTGFPGAYPFVGVVFLHSQRGFPAAGPLFFTQWPRCRAGGRALAEPRLPPEQPDVSPRPLRGGAPLGRVSCGWCVGEVRVAWPPRMI